MKDNIIISSTVLIVMTFFWWMISPSTHVDSYNIIALDSSGWFYETVAINNNGTVYNIGGIQGKMGDKIICGELYYNPFESFYRTDWCADYQNYKEGAVKIDVQLEKVRE